MIAFVYEEYKRFIEMKENSEQQTKQFAENVMIAQQSIHRESLKIYHILYGIYY